MDGGNGNCDPDQPAVFPVVALDAVVGAQLTRNEAVEMPDVFLDVVGVGHFLEADAAQLLLRVPEDVTHRLVGAQPLAVEADERHPVRRVAERVPEPLLAFAEGALRLGSLAYVANETKDRRLSPERDRNRHDLS